MFATLLPALIGLLALAAAVASVVFFLRARQREDAGADAESVAADGLVEMRALGQRIETLVGQQQLQGETARQHLAQKLDAVGEHVDQQRHHVHGLQNELRHEVRRRDAEMDEIRTQLASIQHTAAIGPAATRALPPAPGSSETPAFDSFSFETPTVGTPAFETPAFETPAFETPAFDVPVFSAAAAPFPAVPTGDGLAAFGDSPVDDGWDTGARAAPPASARVTPDVPVFTDPFAFDDPFAAPAPPAAAAAPPAAAAASDTWPTFPPITADPFAADPFATDAGAASPDEASAAAAPSAPFRTEPPADAPAAEPPGTSLFESVSFGEAPGFTFEDFTPAGGPAAPAVQAPAVQAPAFAPPVERAAPAPPSETAWVARAGRPEPAGTPLVALPPVPTFEMHVYETPAAEAPVYAAPAAGLVPSASAPYQTPDGADDLTVISTIDAHTQRALYMAGVTTLDEIARWSRADARRIGADVSISEDTIMNQWVFEAQSALFQSYTGQQAAR